MPALPKVVSEAWEKRDGPIVLATVNQDGVPNAIYATCVKKYGEDKIVIADNYFHKTRANIKAGSPGSLLFITEDRESYQIKGSIDYQQSGEIYEDMKDWLNPKHPGVAATILNVEKVYSGSDRLL